MSRITGIGAAALYWLIVALYMFRPAFVQMVPSPLLKAAPIITLAVYALIRLRSSCVMLTIGLALSACGDIAGDVPGGGFIPQVAFFLLAQIAYLVVFYSEARWHTPRLAIVLPLFAWIGFMVFKLLASSALRDPVLAVALGVYLTAIAGMAVMAVLRQADWWWVVATGALLFVFSDSVIAWSRFVAKWPDSGAVVMWTYYLAQFLIAFGYASGRKLETSV